MSWWKVLVLVKEVLFFVIRSCICSKGACYSSRTHTLLQQTLLYSLIFKLSHTWQLGILVLNNFGALGNFTKEQDECILLNEILKKKKKRPRNTCMTFFPPGKGDSHLLSFRKITWLNFDVKDQICLGKKVYPTQNKSHKKSQTAQSAEPQVAKDTAGPGEPHIT